MEYVFWGHWVMTPFGKKVLAMLEKNRKTWFGGLSVSIKLVARENLPPQWRIYDFIKGANFLWTQCSHITQRRRAKPGFPIFSYDYWPKLIFCQRGAWQFLVRTNAFTKWDKPYVFLFFLLWSWLIYFWPNGGWRARRGRMPPNRVYM